MQPLSHSIAAMIVFAMLSVSVNAAGIAPLVLDFPLIDAPYNNRNGYTAPSMRQSLMFTKSFYQGAHHALEEHFEDQPGLGLLSIIGLDVLFTWTPPGDSWLHEEWHRAVLGQYGIDSENDVYDLPLFADSIAVSHVNDADLVRLKRDHPADQIRLSAAGIEAQTELVIALEKDAFYDDIDSRNGFLLWSNAINSIAYLNLCAGEDADIFTNEAHAHEGANVQKRDFTGLDCTAWVYDLFRPNEPYAARGTHPSGVGIDRYISWSDLTPAERRYLKRQRNLSLLSLVDPFLFGHVASTVSLPGIETPVRWNAALRHYLTSFGYVVDIDLMLRAAPYNGRAVVHWYRNQDHAFPGVTFELLRLPVTGFDTLFYISTSAAVWAQPVAQSFRTAEAETGGWVSVRTDIPLIQHWGYYAEVDLKTAGWVAGTAYLNANTSARFGVTGRW